MLHRPSPLLMLKDKNEVLGLKITANLLNGCILPSGGVASGRVRTQSTEQACFPLFIYHILAQLSVYIFGAGEKNTTFISFVSEVLRVKEISFFSILLLHKLKKKAVYGSLIIPNQLLSLFTMLKIINL